MKHVQRTLAIKGDSKNGKEIISLLELFGANNIHEYNGTDANVYYFINNACNYIIDTYRNDSPKQLEDYLALYTLDDFKARFPYKIGEKVDAIKVGALNIGCEILNMQWNEEYNGMMYYVQDAIKKFWWVKADDIRYTRYGDLKIDLDDIVNENIEFDLSKYSYEVKDGKLAISKKMSVYPKTYKECCDVLLIPPYYNLRYHTYEPDYDEYAATNALCSLQDKLNILGKLLICCKAYWKIAGNEMSLDKPWEPNWKNTKNVKYGITLHDDIITKMYLRNENVILAFPTEKMRDVFYENFKDLIEGCKELL